MRMPEVNGLLFLNSGVSAQYKGYRTGADQSIVEANVPLLEELHHPAAQERIKGAAKLDDLEGCPVRFNARG